MKTQISKSQFKAKALEYFRQVESTGIPLLITDHGKATLEIKPYQATPARAIGVLENTVLAYKAPFEPVAADDWETNT